MSQAAQQQQRPATTAAQPRQKSDLEIALQNSTAKVKEVATQLGYRVQNIEELLPPQFKGQGERMVRRAILTMARQPALQEIPTYDLIRCVMEAAEVGLAIDGKHGYIVKYKSVYQFQADYKGLVVSLRRIGTIKDCYADVVCTNDQFHAWREDGSSHLRHEFDLAPRGDVIGAYAVVVLPDGEWRYELMTREQLDAIQRRAPSKSGPWATDTNEQRKKTVIRRLLKLYVGDPAALRSLSEPWEDDDIETEKAAPTAPPSGRQNLRQKPFEPPAATAQPPQQQQEQEPQHETNGQSVETNENQEETQAPESEADVKQEETEPEPSADELASQIRAKYQAATTLTQCDEIDKILDDRRDFIGDTLGIPLRQMRAATRKKLTPKAEKPKKDF